MTMNWKQTEAHQNHSNPMAMRTRRPNPVDMSEQWIVNDALALGLYRGTYPGLKLASALAYPVAVVPTQFMGIPIAKAKDEGDQRTVDALREIMGYIARPIQNIFLLRRIIGTGWAWPTWDSKNNRICLELIPNSSITDIIRDIQTGEMIKVIITEQITLQSDENTQSIVTRKRTITRDRVKTEYTGQVPTGITNSEVRNPAGVMPIPFPKDVLDNSVRGISVFTRIMPHLKSYHDGDLKWSETLVKFNVKMIKTIKSGSVDEWMASNHIASLDDIDVAALDLDFILDGESVEFVFPTNFTEAFSKRQETSYLNIVEGSGVPEIFFGISVTGNHATAEQDLTTLENTVQKDRDEIDEPFRKVIDACLRLQSIARMETYGDWSHEWNDLETVSAETKAKIFASFGDGVQRLGPSVPLQTLHKFFLSTFPRATTGDFKEFLDQMNLAAKMKQFQTASLVDAADIAGAPGSDAIVGGGQ